VVVIESLQGAGIYAGSFVVAVISGIVPVVNAELYLIGVVLALGRTSEALVLAVIVALGQMISKATLYQAALGATCVGRRKSAKLDAKITRAREYAERWKTKPLSVTFVSATAGLPPLYLVSLVAGLLGVRFRAFVAVGFAGRTLRFATIAVIAAQV
jgi:membrane protein YqaA with SNARE-associated domain